MPRKQYDYHFIYKTVNLVNNKFYIGMHSTSNLEDGYIGSGKRLWYSIKKYGRENFKMEILEFLPDRSSLKLREKEIVNSDLLKEELCMNLKEGGEGGFVSEDHKNKFLAGREWGMIIGNNTASNNRRGTELSDSHKTNISEQLINYFSSNPGNFANKSHTEETKAIIGKRNSISQKGDKNSQYGKCWVFHEKLGNKSIKKDELENYINCGWKLGRKMLK